MESDLTVKHQPELSVDILRKYICPTATEQELYFFLQLCKAQNLNPFLRECYLIKYGTAPATMVTGKETFTKRADRLPQYNGFKAGIILNSGNKIEYREGSFIQKGEILLGGWSEVFRKDKDNSYRIEVTLSEYEGHKQDGTITQQWKTRPATMIRKVALVQSLREAFPDEFGGMYSEEENVPAVPTEDQEEGKPPISMPREMAVVEPAPAPEDPLKQEQTASGETGDPSALKITSGVDSVTISHFKKKDNSQGTKYIIHAGEKYETFSEPLAKEAKRAHETGLIVEIEYTEDKYGRKVKTLTVLEPTESDAA